MKKRLIALMLVAVTTVSLAGCGKRTAGDKDSSSEVSADKIIRVGWYNAWYLPSDYYDEIFENFQTAYPDYKVERTEVTSTTELMAQIQSGTQPDVWLGGDPNTTNLTVGYYEGMFQCLDDYLNNDPDVNFDTLNPEHMKLTKFNDKCYALPVWVTQQCLIYNKKLFAEAGLDPEHAPETWSEWYDYIKLLTKYDSNGFITQLGVENGPWVYQLENSNGTAGTFKEDRISSNYDSDWGLQLVEFVDKVGAITEGKQGASGTDFSINKGNVAMRVHDFQALSDIDLPRDEFGIAYLPKPDGVEENYIPSLLFYFLSIPTGCKNPDGGWLFAKYIMTEGMYQMNADDYMEKPLDYIPGQLSHTPTRERVYKEMVTNLSDTTKAFIEKRDELEFGAAVAVENYSPIQSTYFEIMDKWQEKKSNGEVGTKEALMGIYTEYQAQLETWKQQQEAKGWKFPEGQEAIAP